MTSDGQESLMRRVAFDQFVLLNVAQIYGNCQDVDPIVASLGRLCGQHDTLVLMKQLEREAVARLASNLNAE